jgi:hypothetical protein
MLRKTFVAALAASAVSGGLSMYDRVEAQSGFELVCRGGLQQRAEVIGDGTIFLHFQAMNVGTDTSPPGEGECGWHDRGFRPGEPERIEASGGAAMNYLIGALLNQREFSVFVNNNNAGSMVVSALGP